MLRKIRFLASKGLDHAVIFTYPLRLQRHPAVSKDVYLILAYDLSWTERGEILNKKVRDALMILSPREREAVIAYYGLNGEFLSYKEIASKLFKVELKDKRTKGQLKPNAIRRLVTVAVSKMSRADNGLKLLSKKTYLTPEVIRNNWLNLSVMEAMTLVLLYGIGIRRLRGDTAIAKYFKEHDVEGRFGFLRENEIRHVRMRAKKRLDGKLPEALNPMFRYQEEFPEALKNAFDALGLVDDLAARKYFVQQEQLGHINRITWDQICVVEAFKALGVDQIIMQDFKRRYGNRYEYFNDSIVLDVLTAVRAFAESYPRDNSLDDLLAQIVMIKVGELNGRNVYHALLRRDYPDARQTLLDVILRQEGAYVGANFLYPEWFDYNYFLRQTKQVEESLKYAKQAAVAKAIGIFKGHLDKVISLTNGMIDNAERIANCSIRSTGIVPDNNIITGALIEAWSRVYRCTVYAEGALLDRAYSSMVQIERRKIDKLIEDLAKKSDLFQPWHRQLEKFVSDLVTRLPQAQPTVSIVKQASQGLLKESKSALYEFDEALWNEAHQGLHTAKNFVAEHDMSIEANRSHLLELLADIEIKYDTLADKLEKALKEFHDEESNCLIVFYQGRIHVRKAALYLYQNDYDPGLEGGINDELDKAERLFLSVKPSGKHAQRIIQDIASERGLIRQIRKEVQITKEETKTTILTAEVDITLPVAGLEMKPNGDQLVNEGNKQEREQEIYGWDETKDQWVRLSVLPNEMTNECVHQKGFGRIRVHINNIKVIEKFRILGQRIAFLETKHVGRLIEVELIWSVLYKSYVIIAVKVEANQVCQVEEFKFTQVFGKLNVDNAWELIDSYWLKSPNHNGLEWYQAGYLNIRIDLLRLDKNGRVSVLGNREQKQLVNFSPRHSNKDIWVFLIWSQFNNRFIVTHAQINEENGECVWHVLVTSESNKQFPPKEVKHSFLHSHLTASKLSQLQNIGVNDLIWVPLIQQPMQEAIFRCPTSQDCYELKKQDYQGKPVYAIYQGKFEHANLIGFWIIDQWAELNTLILYKPSLDKQNTPIRNLGVGLMPLDQILRRYAKLITTEKTWTIKFETFENEYYPALIARWHNEQGPQGYMILVKKSTGTYLLLFGGHISRDRLGQQREELELPEFIKECRALIANSIPENFLDIKQHEKFELTTYEDGNSFLAAASYLNYRKQGKDVFCAIDQTSVDLTRDGLSFSITYMINVLLRYMGAVEVNFVEPVYHLWKSIESKIDIVAFWHSELKRMPRLIAFERLLIKVRRIKADATTADLEALLKHLGVKGCMYIAGVYDRWKIAEEAGIDIEASWLSFRRNNDNDELAFKELIAIEALPADVRQANWMHAILSGLGIELTHLLRKASILPLPIKSSANYEDRLRMLDSEDRRDLEKFLLGFSGEDPLIIKHPNVVSKGAWERFITYQSGWHWLASDIGEGNINNTKYKFLLLSEKEAIACVFYYGLGRQRDVNGIKNTSPLRSQAAKRLSNNIVEAENSVRKLKNSDHQLPESLVAVVEKIYADIAKENNIAQVDENALAIANYVKGNESLKRVSLQTVWGKYYIPINPYPQDPRGQSIVYLRKHDKALEIMKQKSIQINENDQITIVLENDSNQGWVINAYLGNVIRDGQQPVLTWKYYHEIKVDKQQGVLIPVVLADLDIIDAYDGFVLKNQTRISTSTITKGNFDTGVVWVNNIPFEEFVVINGARTQFGRKVQMAISKETMKKNKIAYGQVVEIKVTVDINHGQLISIYKTIVDNPLVIYKYFEDLNVAPGNKQKSGISTSINLMELDLIEVIYGNNKISNRNRVQLDLTVVNGKHCRLEFKRNYLRHYNHSEDDRWIHYVDEHDGQLLKLSQRVFMQVCSTDDGSLDVEIIAVIDGQEKVIKRLQKPIVPKRAEDLTREQELQCLTLEVLIQRHIRAVLDYNQNETSVALASKLGIHVLTLRKNKQSYEAVSLRWDSFCKVGVIDIQTVKEEIVLANFIIFRRNYTNIQHLGIVYLTMRRYIDAALKRRNLTMEMLNAFQEQEINKEFKDLLDKFYQLGQVEPFVSPMPASQRETAVNDEQELVSKVEAIIEQTVDQIPEEGGSEIPEEATVIEEVEAHQEAIPIEPINWEEVITEEFLMKNVVIPAVENRDVEIGRTDIKDEIMKAATTALQEIFRKFPDLKGKKLLLVAIQHVVRSIDRRIISLAEDDEIELEDLEGFESAAYVTLPGQLQRMRRKELGSVQIEQGSILERVLRIYRQRPDFDRILDVAEDIWRTARLCADDKAREAYLRRGIESWLKPQAKVTIPK